ncbi:MAG: hypothetical protein U1F81_09285 [Verrucomicrobiaceae bacterium]
MPGHAAEAVVRIIGDRVERGEVFLGVTGAVAIAVLHTQDAVALGEVNPALGAAFDMHRGIGLVVEDAAVFAVGIENENLIVLRAVVAFWPMMRVACGEPDASFFIDINAGGRDEIGMLGEQRQLHAGLQRFDLRIEIGGNDGSLWQRA